MLPNTISLSITVPSALSFVFERVNLKQGDREQYVEETLHDYLNLCSLDLRRTFPKPNGDFPGVKRTQSKVTMSVDYTDKAGETKSGVIIQTLQTSFPVGVVDGDDVTKAQQLFAAWQGHTNYSDFVVNQEL